MREKETRKEINSEEDEGGGDDEVPETAADKRRATELGKRYIATDKHTEQQQSLHTEQDAERRLSAISFSGKESGGLPSAPHSSWKSPRHEEMVSVHNSVGTSAGEGTVVNLCSTGDPAQDMLDLLLGPLLKKPAREENKIGLIKEDMTFAVDITKQGRITLVRSSSPIDEEEKQSQGQSGNVFGLTKTNWQSQGKIHLV
ncbi:hypothetical protein C3L33_15029, partial [Rhododendron williamsianum]